MLLDAGATPRAVMRSAIRRVVLPMLAVSGVINILGLTLPIYTLSVFDRVFTSRSEDTLLFLALAALLGLGCAALLEAFRSLAFGRVANWVTYTLAPEALGRSIERRLVDGRLRTELLREISNVRAFMGGPSAAGLLDLPWLPLYFAIAVMIHPLFGVLSLIGMVLLFGVAFATDRMLKTDIAASAEIGAEVMRDGDALVRNAEIVDSLGMTSTMVGRWSRGMFTDLEAQERIQARTATALGITRFARAALQVAVYGFAALLVIDEQLTAGAVIAASIIVSRLLAPVEAVIGQWRALRTARESFGKLEKFFAMPRRPVSDLSLPRPIGQLTVDQVMVRMPGQLMPVLRSVSFAIAAGEQLAIVGPAGSGKTTLARLLIGISRPDLGTVRLDGVDVASWDREEFGRWVGYLPQDVELFAGTVADNISRFRRDDDPGIVAAARFAGCHDMILSLPRGYETQIGDDGVLLSGGQRQQIGLARALFSRPRFLVLDEPNSNLDVRGDNALSRALKRLSEMKVTVVIITHRPYILSAVDKILVLERGAVRSFGAAADMLVAKPRAVSATDAALARAAAQSAPTDAAPAEAAK